MEGCLELSGGTMSFRGVGTRVFVVRGKHVEMHKTMRKKDPMHAKNPDSSFSSVSRVPS
jgi:hypothetical protein